MVAVRIPAGRAAAGLAAAAALAAALAACSSGGPHGRTTPLVPTAAEPSATNVGHEGAPVLGASWTSGQKGYGQARPEVIDSGGDQAGYVGAIAWEGWGSDRATGRGTGYLVEPGRAVTEARPTDAVLVAFDLDTCDGVPAYRKLEWYFPAAGQRFDPGQGADVCGDGSGDRPIPPTPTTAPPTTAPPSTSATTSSAASSATSTPASSTAPPPTWLGPGPDPFTGRRSDTDGLAAGAVYFTSPSGNFSCGIVGPSYGMEAHAGCAGQTSPVPPRPDSCPDMTGWGEGMVVGADGAVKFRCSGDAGYDPHAAPLGYGYHVRALGFACASQERGIYCRDEGTGHGFMIAHGDNDVY